MTSSIPDCPKCTAEGIVAVERIKGPSEKQYRCWRCEEEFDE